MWTRLHPSESTLLFLLRSNHGHFPFLSSSFSVLHRRQTEVPSKHFWSRSDLFSSMYGANKPAKRAHVFVRRLGLHLKQMRWIQSFQTVEIICISFAFSKVILTLSSEDLLSLAWASMAKQTPSLKRIRGLMLTVRASLRSQQTWGQQCMAPSLNMAMLALWTPWWSCSEKPICTKRKSDWWEPWEMFLSLNSSRKSWILLCRYVILRFCFGQRCSAGTSCMRAQIVCCQAVVGMFHNINIPIRANHGTICGPVYNVSIPWLSSSDV